MREPGPAERLLQRLAAVVDQLGAERRVAVAIDGPDAAGKTTLAGQLAERVSRPSVVASVDGWQNPPEARRRRGDSSPEGYYRDCFAYDALIADLIEPFRAGSADVRTACFDQPRESAVTAVQQDVGPRAVLLMEGVFLLRPELRSSWDLTVYLHVPEDVTLARALQRDLAHFGTAAELTSRYERRYLPGQALYRQEADPVASADVVIDNSDPERPVVQRWPVGDR